MKHSASVRQAFSLIEVTVAIGVVAFSMLAIVGLLPIASQITRDSASQTNTSEILSSVVADMRATPKGSTTSPQYGIPLSGTSTLYFDGSGQVSTSLKSKSRYTLTVTPAPAGSGVIYADIALTWPAAATLGNSVGSVETVAAFNRN